MKSLSIASVAVAAAALSAVAVPSVALAADSSVAFNAGVVTDYRYRGISQSRLQPALQGGVDFTAGRRPGAARHRNAAALWPIEAPFRMPHDGAP